MEFALFILEFALYREKNTAFPIREHMWKTNSPLYSIHKCIQ